MITSSFAPLHLACLLASMAMTLAQAADRMRAPHQSELLASALKAAGVPVTFHTVPGGGHGGFTDPKVPKTTREFLAKHLKAAPRAP